MIWKTAQDFMVNSVSGRLPVWGPRPMTALEAWGVGLHEALHRSMVGLNVSWWVCHIEGTPDDAWVVDMVVDGQFLRFGVV